MTDATERPPHGPDPEPADSADTDAWADACAEDLAAERARRRAGAAGDGTGSPAEEFLKLVDAVSERLSGIGGPLFGAAGQGAAQQAVRQVVRQAKAAVEPVIERNPQVFDHLAAAGSELLAAYRSAVADQETRWTRDRGTGESDREDPGPRGQGRGPGPEESGPGEHIDLD